MYRFKEIYQRGVCYWPVLAKPGRQRHARLGFDDPRAARIYGIRLVERWIRVFGFTQEIGITNLESER